MPRRNLGPATTLSEQAALNWIASGVAGLRSTDTFVSDAKGATLSLSVTNASLAIPASARSFAFWSDVATRWRLGIAADLTDGAYLSANDVQMIVIDPDDVTPPATIQAILASGTGTLTVTWFYGT